jgi:hypothetical protein
MAEVMPMQIRGKGNAFAVGIGNWAVSTLWNQVSPIALGKLQWKFYFVFVAWSQCLIPVCFSLPLLTLVPDLCVSLPVIYFYFPETKQKTLEEIDQLFERVVERIPQEGNVVHLRSGKEEAGITAMNIENAGRPDN